MPADDANSCCPSPASEMKDLVEILGYVQISWYSFWALPLSIPTEYYKLSWLSETSYPNHFTFVLRRELGGA